MKDADLSKNLLRWYRSHGRSLPWRRTRNPYRIWISEVMSQQTQAERAAEYYQRFLARFPTLSDLAAARWTSVLSAWRGLGYYSRARNLLRTARVIEKDYAGNFPRTLSQLQSLPGIGSYTASAIACFAFKQPLPALDTNLRRVLGRVFGCAPAEVAERSTALFSRNGHAAAELNQALMDLGAKYCKSRSVECKACPIQKQCSFCRSGHAVRKMPKQAVKKVSVRKRAVDVGVACIHKNGEYLICKRPKTRGGEWEFPGGKREPKESIRAALKREIMEELRVEVSVRPPFLVYEYQDGRKRWRLHFCRCQILRGKPRRTEHTALKWISPEKLRSHPFPLANRKAVTRLLTMR